MRLFRFATLTLPFVICIHALSASGGNPIKFLVVSTPRDGKISYMRLFNNAYLKGSSQVAPMETLVSTGLAHPQGIAVDPRLRLLYVADPDSKNIFAYPLTATETTLSAGNPSVLARGVEARWVSVDGHSNVFFSEEPQNQIMRIPFANVLVNTTPEVVFDGMTMMQVSAPGGLAADTFHTYWVNKQTGTQVGSLIQAKHSSNASLTVQSARIMAVNTDKSYGLCLGLNNIFYTQPASVVYGMPMSGGDPVLISDRLVNPRGCAWDGDGTIYIADRGANAIYSFPGNMPVLQAVPLQQVVKYEDAFGIAVYRTTLAPDSFNWKKQALLQWNFAKSGTPTPAPQRSVMLVAVFVALGLVGRSALA